MHARPAGREHLVMTTDVGGNYDLILVDAPTYERALAEVKRCEMPPHPIASAIVAGLTRLAALCTSRRRVAWCAQTMPTTLMCSRLRSRRRRFCVAFPRRDQTPRRSPGPS